MEQKEKIKTVILEPEKIADALADRLQEMSAKTPGIRKIRNSHILTGIVGATGLALFLVGVEKVFINLPGPQSILLGLAFLTISGALLKKL